MSGQLLGTLSRIQVFPIKSLDGVCVEECGLTPGGALRNDRRFALIDADGRFINGKRCPRIQRIASAFDLEQHLVTLSDRDGAGAQTFSLQHEHREIEQWCGGFLGQPVTLQEATHRGFPDDVVANGPTVISTQSLEEVCTWFPGLDLEEARRRFRANLEIDAEVPFAEDRLFADVEEQVRFFIGSLELLGSNPCARCAVPGRNSRTGEPDAGFQRTFTRQRQSALPGFVQPARFDHFYRLAVNTRVAEESVRAGARLRTGDEVRIIGVVPGGQSQM